MLNFSIGDASEQDLDLDYNHRKTIKLQLHLVIHSAFVKKRIKERFVLPSLE